MVDRNINDEDLETVLWDRSSLRASKKCRRYFEHRKGKTMKVKRKLLEDAARYVMIGMCWAETPQGHKYWCEVRRNLLELVQTPIYEEDFPVGHVLDEDDTVPVPPLGACATWCFDGSNWCRVD